MEIKQRSGRKIIETESDWLRPAPEVVVGGVEAAYANQREFGWPVEPYVLITSPATHPCEIWLDARRQELTASAIARGRAKVESAFAESDWKVALDWMHFLQELQPDDDELAVLRAETFTLAGDQRQATKAIHEFQKRVSAKGIQWEPSATLEGLEEISSRRDQRLTDVTPLRGRAMESGILGKTLTDKNERFRVVAILGRPGVGKTRLVREALQRATLRGCRVYEASSNELESAIPFGPLLDSLGPAIEEADLGVLGEPWREVLQGLWTSTHPPSSPVSHHIAEAAVSRRVFETVRVFLDHLAQKSQTVLFLDDLHWADASTVVALDYVRRRWSGPGMICLVALRAEEVPAGSTLDRFLAGLSSNPDAQVLELGEVDLESATAIVKDACGPNLSDEQASEFVAFAGANPLFLHELCQEVLAGRISPELGEGLRNLNINQLPLSIRNLVQDRLKKLQPVAREGLDILAVLDHPIGLEDMGSLITSEPEELSDAVDALAELRLASLSGDTLKIRHPVIRSIVYGGMGAARLREIHRRVAFFLNDQPGTPPNVLAIHFSRAGLNQQAVELSREAVKAARACGALPEALGMLEVAIENTGSLEPRAELLFEKGHILCLAQDFIRAGPVLDEARSALESSGNRADALLAEAKRLDALGHLGVMPNGEILRQIGSVRDQALHLGAYETAAEALDFELKLLVRQDNVEAIQALLGEVTNHVDKGSPTARCRMRMLFIYERLLGSMQRPFHLITEAVEIARLNGLKASEFQALHRLLVLLFQYGEVRVGQNPTHVEVALQAASESGDLDARFRLLANLGAWHVDIAEPEQAREYLQEAAEVSAGSGNAEHRLVLLVNLGELAILEGLFQEAFELFGEAAQQLPLVESPRAGWMIRPGLGLAALETGRMSVAREQMNAIPEVPNRTRFHARFLQTRGRRADAERLLEEVIGEVRHQMPPIAIKLTRELLRVADDWRRYEELVAWSLGTADRLRLPQQSYALRASVT
ncbi:MAG: ATP-binding protein [Planctomycetota bacterium]